MADFPVMLRMANEPRITSNTPVYSSESISLIQKKRKIPAQRWEVTADFTAYGYEDVKRSDAWVFKQNGSFNTFTFSLGKFNAKPDGVAPQSAIAAAGSIGDSELSVTPIANLTETDEGFFIRVTGDTKIYMVTGITKNGAVDTLEIFPPLRKEAAYDAVVYLNAEFTMRLSDNMTSGEYMSGRLLKTWNFKLVEAL